MNARAHSPSLSLGARLLWLLTPTVLGAILLVSMGGYLASQKAILNQTDRELSIRIQAQTEDLASHFERAQQGAEDLAGILASAPALRPQDLQRWLQEAVGRNVDLQGMAVLMIPEATPLGPCDIRAYREGATVKLRTETSSQAEYAKAVWFQKMWQNPSPSWGDPHRRRGTSQILLVTCAVPFRWQGHVAGIVTADLGMPRLSEFLASGLTPGSGSAYLAAKGGRLVLADHEETLQDAARCAQLEKLLTNPLSGHGEAVDPVTGRSAWIVERPLGHGPEGWKLIATVPTDTLLAPLHRIRSLMIVGSALVVGLVALAVIGTARSVARRLGSLATQAQRYADGEFDAPLPEDQGPSEIRRLAHVFNGMGQAIVGQLEEIRLTTAQRERYHHELVLAAELQQGVLPKHFPLFEDLVDQVDLFGAMTPAKEVGGDYFDCFRLPNGHLGLVVGDVSGKGAPAALFMTQTRLLIRLLAAQGLRPCEVLRQANRVLVEELPRKMFVSLVYVEYDPATGHFVHASAGHPHPILAEPGASPCAWQHPHALPLGAFGHASYVDTPGHLVKGALLLLHSDGLDEAMNPMDQAFGVENILANLAEHPGLSCADQAACLRETVREFTRGAEASDDLTLLLCRRL